MNLFSKPTKLVAEPLMFEINGLFKQTIRSKSVSDLSNICWTRNNQRKIRLLCLLASILECLKLTFCEQLFDIYDKETQRNIHLRKTKKRLNVLTSLWNHSLWKNHTKNFNADYLVMLNLLTLMNVTKTLKSSIEQKKSANTKLVSALFAVHVLKVFRWKRNGTKSFDQNDDV